MASVVGIIKVSVADMQNLLQETMSIHNDKSDLEKVDLTSFPLQMWSSAIESLTCINKEEDIK